MLAACNLSVSSKGIVCDKLLALAATVKRWPEGARNGTCDPPGTVNK